MEYKSSFLNLEGAHDHLPAAVASGVTFLK